MTTLRESDMRGSITNRRTAMREPTTENPRYRGAAPEDVARVLLRAPRPGREPVVGGQVAVEQPSPDEPGDDVRHLR